jgi:membrane protein implicated in regulation of membrane protease activity
MRAALILMAIAFVVAIAKAVVGAPVIDGVTFLVVVLVVASLAAYYRASLAPRRDR